jgi:hypothetical protein
MFDHDASGGGIWQVEIQIRERPRAAVHFFVSACRDQCEEECMARFVKFVSGSEQKLDVYINPEEVAAVRDSHGKTIVIFRGVAITETVTGSVASVVAALEHAP